jgi:hypothetical protein
MPLTIAYRHVTTGALCRGTVVYVQPQTGELLVVADDGLREYVNPDRVVKEPLPA